MEREVLLKAKELIEHEGLSITKTAEQLKVNRHTLSKELKVNGIEINNKYKKQITPELIEQMKELLNNGKNFKEISEIVGLDKHTVSDELKKLGLSSKYAKNRGISKEKVVAIYEEFLESGMTLTEFCDKTNQSLKVLSSNFKKNNLEIPKSNGEKSLNSNYFDTLDEDSTYWLGLLLADGYVDKYYEKLELTLKDKEHVEKFKSSLNSGHIIQERIVKNEGCNDCTTFRINIHNKHMVGRLKQLGVVNNKTYQNLIISDEVNNELMHHFIRGIFDGDGHFTHNTERTGIRHMGFTQYDKESLCIIQNILEEQVGIKSYIHEQPDRAPALLIYDHNDIKKLCDWMYNDSHLYLDRKFHIYKELIAVDKE